MFDSSPCRRFLITGGKGFLGTWVAKNLVEQGQCAFIFDTDPGMHRLAALLSEEQLARLRFLSGDVTNLEDLEAAVADNGISHIIHLAALQVPACAANPLLGAKVNVLGTLNTFEVAKRRRELVRRIVYASSAAVYGPAEFYGNETVTEDAALLPGTHYGVFKLCNEGNARVYFLSDGISSIGLRAWAVYGAGRDQGISSGPTKAIKAAVLGCPYTIGFTGAVDLQYADDCAKTILRCAESELAGARVYTLRGSVVRVDDFIATLQRLLPAARGLIRAEGNPLPIAADLDDSALRRDFGSVPQTPLEEGIRQTAEIFRRLQRQGRLNAEDLDV